MRVVQRFCLRLGCIVNDLLMRNRIPVWSLIKIENFRFFARNLSVPIWLLLAVTLLLEAVDMLFGDQLFAGLDWQTIGYMALLCLMGICTTWLGIRLLKLQSPYPALKVMAWLDIVGGLMLASVLLMLVALLPLLGAGVALMLVFLS